MLGLASHPGLNVSPSTSDITGTKAAATAYAGIKIQADGEEFRTPANGDSGYTTTLGLWLDSGAPENVWVQWTRSGGSLGDWNDTDDGDARLQLSADRNWRIARTSSGTDTIIGTFDFFDAASGGVQIGTSGERTFTATYDP